MASSKSRIFWLPLEENDKLWTKGWLPDSDALRWSLAAAVRVEGIRDGWGPCHAVSEAAWVYPSYIGETEDGEYVECTPDGTTLHGESIQPVAATIAILR